MSSIGAEDDPIFRGRTPGGISCTEFVRTVRRHAVAERKARDNEYIADYAMSCLDDEALLWSETLSVEVQGDWSLLRRALLAEYVVPPQQVTSLSVVISSAVAAHPPPLVPGPASSAPPSLTVSPGCYFVKCVATNTTLNNCAWGPSPGNPIIAWRQEEQLNSKWRLNLKPGSTTEYYLVNVGNNMPIGYSGTLAGNKCMPTLQNTPAYFTIIHVEENHHLLVITGTDYVFDVEGSNPNDGAAVLFHPIHGHPNQLWIFEATEP